MAHSSSNQPDRSERAPADGPPEEQPPQQAPQSLGQRIRALRQKQKLSLSELARLADVSKGYLSQVERSKATRPSAITIFAIADALDVSVTELFEGEETESRPSSVEVELPDSLRAFALEAELPPVDVDMLAAIRYRGLQPDNTDDWRFLYESIRRSVGRGRH